MNLDHLPQLDSQLRVLHIGGYWRHSNDTVRHMMEGLRQAGAHVAEFSTDEHRDALDTEGRRYDRGTTGPVWLRWKLLQPHLEQIDPHLVVCNAGGLAFRSEVAAEVRRRRCLIGVTLSDPAVFEPTTRHIAGTFDRVITNHEPSVDKYRALGVDAVALRFGTNPEFFHPVSPAAAHECDVVVLGHAHRDRVEPVTRLRQTFDVRVYGEGWASHAIPSLGTVFGEESLAVINSARCVVVFDRGIEGDRLVKPSLFDFTAAGALVVTNASTTLDRYFAANREVATFTDVDDLVRVVGNLVSDPGAAAAIRRAGRQRTLRDHSWSTAWHEMLRPTIDLH